MVQRLAFVGIAWLVSLLATVCLLPHTFGSWSETLTMMFAAFLMLVFGPYLLVVGLCDGRVGGVYALNEKTFFAVSRGLARESTPLPRFFNHPEIMVVGLLANGAEPVHSR